MDHFSEGKLITVIKSFIFKGDKYANIYHRFSCGWSEKISHISSADSMKDSNRYKGVFFIGKLVNLVIRRCILDFIFLYQNDAQIALLFINKKIFALHGLGGQGPRGKSTHCFSKLLI